MLSRVPAGLNCDSAGDRGNRLLLLGEPCNCALASELPGLPGGGAKSGTFGVLGVVARCNSTGGGLTSSKESIITESRFVLIDVSERDPFS